jgi:hypothetical protein
VSCRACARLQLTIAEKTFGCKYCGKVTRLDDAKPLFQSASHEEALGFLYKAQMPKSP